MIANKFMRVETRGGGAEAFVALTRIDGFGRRIFRCQFRTRDSP